MKVKAIIYQSGKKVRSKAFKNKTDAKNWVDEVLRGISSYNRKKLEIKTVFENTEENRGGKRTGSGVKSLFKEKTTTITVRVPESNKEEIKKQFQQILNKYRIF